jgi:hypothetical protein
VYPWDVAHLGVDAVLGDIRAVGLAGLDLASTYHPIATFSPRTSARRMMYSELGAVFFPARTARYGRIRPAVWPDTAVTGVWPKVNEAVARFGLELSAWTIALFQPWIAHEYPDCARVLPTGDRVFAGVCPAAPDVQQYVAALSADIAEQFPAVRVIRLESVNFPAADFSFGWVRPAVGLDMSPWTAWLLGLCFCEHCVRRAQAREVDVEGLRRRILDAVITTFDQGIPARPLAEERALWQDKDRDFAGFVAARDDASVELVHAAAEAVGAVSRTSRIGVADMDSAGAATLSIDRVVADIGSILVRSPYSRPREARAAQLLAAGADHPIELAYLAGGRGERLGSPLFRRELACAISLPVDHVSFVNFGLLTPRQLSRMCATAHEYMPAGVY